MRLITFGPAIAITLLGFVVAWQFVNPAPPTTITIATGHEDGAYYLFAQRYRELLAAEGIDLLIRPTAGSVENIRLLEDAAADIDLAFVQGGTGDPAGNGRITALGSLYFEPLWVFYRDTATVSRLTELQDKRIAAGTAGSGTYAIARTLLAANRIDTDSGAIRQVGGDTAAQALLQDEVDAAFFVAAPEAPVIQALLHEPGIRLMSFDRDAAYARRYPYMSSITLPEGIIDLHANLPPQDTVLLAPTAILVTHDDFHPALVSLLLQIATRVHGDGDLFVRPGEFPNGSNTGYPLDADAGRYYRQGTPFLQRYLPFWTANLIDRLKIMLVPLVTLLIPLFKIMPPAYRWQVRKKIYRWYTELRVLDIEHPELVPAAQLRELLQRLASMEEDVRHVSVPLSYTDELYNLRQHIRLVRRKLQRIQAG
jgi:TRAP transporter TAXI family solute receptor